MTWIVLVFGLMGVLGIAYAVVYLWTLTTSTEDLERLEECDLYGRWVLERLGSEYHALLSQRRLYCRLYAKSMLPLLEEEMEELARLWNRPILSALMLLAFKLVTTAIWIKIRFLAGPNDLRGAVAMQILLLRMSWLGSDAQQAR
ncbi:MAG: hypothetical protein V3T83_00235 [Acidobacteriota bacterium]